MGEMEKRALSKSMFWSFWLIALQRIRYLAHPIHTAGILWERLIELVVFATNPWRKMLMFLLYPYFTLFGRISYVTVNILFLPINILVAHKRDKMLELRFQEAEMHRATLVKLNTELERKVNMFMKDCNHMKKLLRNAEDGKARLSEKNQQLQAQVKNLQLENMTLKAERKVAKESKRDNGKQKESSGDKDCNASLVRLSNRKVSLGKQVVKGVNNNDNEEVISSHRGDALHSMVRLSDRKLSVGKQVEVSVNNHDNEEMISSHRGEALHLMVGLLDRKPSVGKQVLSVNKNGDEEAIRFHRGHALHSSVFSVLLCLIVAMISWQAQDPCTPLVVASFIVVCVASRHVVGLFLTLHDYASLDALLLLCSNWFIMGILTYPAMPSVGTYVEPFATKFCLWSIGLLGFHTEENPNTILKNT